MNDTLDINTVDCQIDVDNNTLWARCPKCRHFSVKIALPYNKDCHSGSVLSTIKELVYHFKNFTSICFEAVCFRQVCFKIIDFSSLGKNIANQNKRWLDLLKLQILVETMPMSVLQEKKFLNIKFV